jgi:hypothetical protein
VCNTIILSIIWSCIIQVTLLLTKFAGNSIKKENNFLSL